MQGWGGLRVACLLWKRLSAASESTSGCDRALFVVAVALQVAASSAEVASLIAASVELASVVGHGDCAASC